MGTLTFLPWVRAGAGAAVNAAGTVMGANRPVIQAGLVVTKTLDDGSTSTVGSASPSVSVTMPVLGAICIVLTIVHAYLARFQRSVSNTLLAAAILFIAAGFITRFGNQAINAIVMTWQADAPPPPGWTDLRDQWWQWHVERTAAGLLGFILVVAASIRGERS